MACDAVAVTDPLGSHAAIVPSTDAGVVLPMSANSCPLNGRASNQNSGVTGGVQNVDVESLLRGFGSLINLEIGHEILLDIPITLPFSFATEC